MQQELNHTVQTLLGSRSLDEVPRDQLEGLVLEFPYASPLQLLYAKKLQLLRDPGYADQVSRTALYFNNPHWLNFQLWNRESKDLWADEEPAIQQPLVEMTAASQMQEASGPGDVSSDGVEESSSIESIQAEHPPAQPLKPWHEPSVRALHTEGVSVNPENFPADPGDFQQTPAPADAIIASEPALPEPVVAAEPESGETMVAAQPVLPETVFAAEPVSGETIVEAEPALPGPVVAAGPESEPLIPVEPFYTIDYFASQGIQLTEAENQDNLGRKLKSFTDWLKTMKKVHSEKREPSIDAFAEARIKEGADRSNDLKEVWTEAMAEVYLKQGLKHKALEVYQKLSLQNPAQSANFAAKIAELND